MTAKPQYSEVEITLLTGETITYPGADWVHRKRNGEIQVRKGTFRVLATHPVGTRFITRGYARGG